MGVSDQRHVLLRKEKVSKFRKVRFFPENPKAQYTFLTEDQQAGKMLCVIVVIEPENSSPSSQQPTIGSYPSLLQPVSILNLYSEIFSNIILPSTPWFPEWYPSRT
jgi:hypothetical protein